MATYAPEYNPEAKCGDHKASDRVDWLVKEKGMDHDAAVKKVMDEHKDAFPDFLWDPDLVCGDFTAQQRAQWLVDNQEMSMYAAKQKVKSEYEALFKEGGRHPHTMSLVKGADGHKLRIVVCPKKSTEWSLAAVHYTFGEKKKIDVHNHDLHEKDKIPGTDAYQHISSCNYPSENPTVYYWLACQVKGGPILSEPNGANGANETRLEWTAATPSAAAKHSDGGYSAQGTAIAIEIPDSSKQWERYEGKNCYNGQGGQNVDLDADNSEAKHMSVEDAKAYCEREGYAGFTYEPSKNRMWRLKEISNPKDFVVQGNFDVYQRWQWEHYEGKNCYNGQGGQNVDLDADNAEAKHMSVEDAKAYCAREGYAGFTYEPSTNRMWRLKEISNPTDFVGGNFDVYQRSPAK